MGLRLFQREEKFFDLLEQQAQDALLASAALKEVVGDWSNKQHSLQRLRELENDCDFTTHEILDKINRSFVTPLDREDIHLLAKRLSRLVDLIQKIGSRMVLFKMQHATKDLIELVNVLNEACDYVLKAVSSIRKIKNPRRILDYCIQISNLENLGDRGLEKALETLFQEPFEPKEVIQWKEIYDFNEAAINSCEDIANIIESIVAKYG